ncbi:hypothetical protein DAI18_00385 [Microvirgula aerodenitrificans]|uniref:Uncharacterized protein n=1 Tax=Microvirgula aerodenitrificans TaxID=57480 RepID=A0A2U3TGZ9_9NEIS|nr:hypothetical protein DAI18_00385 [Microvirgula aerodenitrificans]
MPVHTSRPGLYGLVALCLAMGLGRFFYTSMLPPMLAEQRLTLADGSALAFWNYAGYLAGSMVMARYPLARRLSLRRGLMAGAGLTVLTMAAMIPDCPPALWSALRFVAGFASALMFVCISTLVLPRADAATRAYCLPASASASCCPACCPALVKDSACRRPSPGRWARCSDYCRWPGLPGHLPHRARRRPRRPPGAPCPSPR